MAKFRRNHTGGTKGIASKMIVRLFVLVAAVIGALIMWIQGENTVPQVTSPEESEHTYRKGSGDYLPDGSGGEIIHHKHFSLSYNERHEQADWVAYELTANQIYADNVKRTDYFEQDPKVSSGSATYGDYKGSGYSKGHLVPSGDRNFSREANVETFYMSNISPQLRAFNGGIWNELEMNVRDWAVDNDRVIVITGPILEHRLNKIGRSNKVSVPNQFFKIVLDYTRPEVKAIAFLIPNELSTAPLSNYLVSIDQIEQKTGLDFFSSFLDDQTEEKLESTVSSQGWRFKDKWFDQRIKVWNKQ